MKKLSYRRSSPRYFVSPCRACGVRAGQPNRLRHGLRSMCSCDSRLHEGHSRCEHGRRGSQHRPRHHQTHPGNSASMRQFNEAVEKNGFTHKDADVIAKGKLTGTAAAPYLEVAGTQDRFALTPAAAGTDIASLLGKTVTVAGVLPQAPKGKVSDTLRYKTISEAR